MAEIGKVSAARSREPRGSIQLRSSPRDRPGVACGVVAMVAVTGGTSLRETAPRAVTFSAALLGRQQNVAGHPAGASGVALVAANDRMLGVVKFTVRQPSVGRGDTDDLRHSVRAARPHLMAVGATGKAGAGGNSAGRVLRSELFRRVGGEENLLLQIFAVEHALTKQAHLLGNKLFGVSSRGDALAAGKVGILRREAAQVSAHVGGGAMRDVEFRVASIKL